MFPGDGAPHGANAEVVLDEPQAGIAPGQACVFYDDDRVLGGGWICRDNKSVMIKLLYP